MKWNANYTLLLKILQKILKKSYKKGNYISISKIKYTNIIKYMSKN